MTVAAIPSRVLAGLVDLPDGVWLDSRANFCAVGPRPGASHVRWNRPYYRPSTCGLCGYEAVLEWLPDQDGGISFVHCSNDRCGAA